MNWPLVAEYDESGGYDTRTGAFVVKDEDGKTVFVVDLMYYGQRAGDWWPRGSAVNRSRTRAAKLEAIGVLHDLGIWVKT